MLTFLTWSDVGLVLTILSDFLFNYGWNVHLSESITFLGLSPLSTLSLSTTVIELSSLLAASINYSKFRLAPIYSISHNNGANIWSMSDGIPEISIECADINPSPSESK